MASALLPVGAVRLTSYNREGGPSMRKLKLFVLAILLCNLFIFSACHRPDTDQTRNSNESGSPNNASGDNRSASPSSNSR